MRVCVYGAGVIGGILGSAVARAGHEVSLVARGAHLTRDFLIDLQQGHEPDGRVTAGRTY